MCVSCVFSGVNIGKDLNQFYAKKAKYQGIKFVISFSGETLTYSWELKTKKQTYSSEIVSSSEICAIINRNITIIPCYDMQYCGAFFLFVSLIISLLMCISQCIVNKNSHHQTYYIISEKCFCCQCQAHAEQTVVFLVWVGGTITKEI